MDVQLFAKNQTNNQYVNLDLFTEQPIKLTLAVSNIVDPLSANSVFSRTFRVPHTSKNGPYFKAVFNVNSTDFDASIKADAYINDNGIYFSSGNIRLSAIYTNEQTNNVEYEINYYGETSDFGSKIGGGFLSEVDLSSYNHDQTYTNITNSWGGGLFSGDIVYPLVEWGYEYASGIPTSGTFSKYTGAPSNKGTFGPISSPPPTANVIRQSMMKPSIRAKALWDKIFEETGYTYTSTFLNSSEFLNLYIISEDQARSELNASQLFSATSSVSQTNNSGGTYDVFFNVEAFDNGNQFNPVTSIFTAGATSGVPYLFNYDIFFAAPLIPPLRAVGAFIQLVDADTNSLLASTGSPTVITNSGSFNANGYFSVTLTAGQRVRIRVQYTSLNPPNADVPITIYFQSLTLISAPENVNMSSVMPSNIRKVDFMRSIINRFRLVFVPSKEFTNQFEITPWKDWILQGNSIDWTAKLDGSKDMKITPLFYGQERLQVYKDQEDADFVNYNYQLDYKQTYGQLNRDSNNELIKGVRTIQDQFAPTPIYPMGSVNETDPLYEMPFPHLAKDTNTERQPIQPKLRLVYYNGVQIVPGGNQWWLQADFGGPNAQTVFPLMSQYSTWPVNSSTFDLSWENEAPLYNTEISGLPTGRTTFDQFNVYWKTWYDVSFDPYSRIVEANFVLDWSDVINIKFNNYVFVKDAWYFVNKITDYIAGQNTNCRVELVKLGNNIGLTLPITVSDTYTPVILCTAATRCDAYCCRGRSATYYLNSIDLATSTFIYTDAYGSIPAPSGWYSDGISVAEVGLGGAIIAYGAPCECTPTSGYAFTVCRGTTYCESCCCEGTSATVYGSNSSFYANVNLYSDALLTTPVANGWYKLTVGGTQSIYTLGGVVQYANLCSSCTCGPVDTYTPFGFKFAETLCGVCCDGTDVTLWLLDPETPADATILYADNSGTSRAGAGYYKYGTDVLIVDAFGNVTAYGNCDGCSCGYFYVAQNCDEEILQNFSYPTPLALGTVVSSSSFTGQCWTIIDYAVTGLPIDFVYETCDQCKGIVTPCECINYEISAGDRGGAFQYLDCTTQTVMYRDLAPNTAITLCACRDSVIALTIGIIITEVGPCETIACTTYELTSMEGGAVDATLCGEELPVGIPVNPGEFFRICAVTGSVTVSLGSVTIDAIGPC